MKLWVIVPAAGIGSRFGGKIPKQYIKLDDKCSVIEHALQSFLALDALQKIVVCLHKDDNYWQQCEIAQHFLIERVVGGDTRAQSVLNGLKQLLQLGVIADDLVLVHDAARPNLAQDDLLKLIYIANDEESGAILAHPVTDSLKLSYEENGKFYIQQNIERQNIWQAFTPQVFRFGLLMDAITKYPNVTDEASAMHLAGYKVRLVAGSRSNIKLTTKNDEILLKALLAKS